MDQSSQQNIHIIDKDESSDQGAHVVDGFVIEDSKSPFPVKEQCHSFTILASDHR